MNMLSKIVSPAGRFVRRGLFVGVAPLLVAIALAPSVRAQDAQAPGGNANGGGGGGDQGGGGRRGRGGFSPEQMMEQIRTQLAVTDDAQWGAIQPLVQNVMDLRRATQAGGFGGFGGGQRGQRGQGGGGGGGGFQRPAPNPDVEALRQALTDNMPDAEIKARLAHLREVRKNDEAKLEKARVDLLAVLTPRQEAVAVMLGLLN
jgi:Spy/CpxP family protein refolding chaperone